MKRRHLRIYRKRRKKKTLILILICILLIGIAAAERIGYIDMEQFISNKQEAIPYQKVSKTAEENTEKYYYRQLPGRTEASLSGNPGRCQKSHRGDICT